MNSSGFSCFVEEAVGRALVDQDRGRCAAARATSAVASCSRQALAVVAEVAARTPSAPQGTCIGATIGANAETER